KAKLESFIGGWASEAETREAIRIEYIENDYVIDPHTAVATSVYRRLQKETNNTTKTVIVSTASPYKFAESVLEEIQSEKVPEDDYDQAILLNKLSHTEIPKAVEEIRTAPILHNKVCETGKMQTIVENILKII
ncbi:MAG: threonine synthase, partial [Mobilitalea sp.]